MVRKSVTGVRLLVASRLLTLAFNRAGVGLCLVDPDNQVITANSRWLEGLGLTTGQTAGRDILDLFPNIGDLLALAKAGQAVEFSRSGPPSLGEDSWFEGSIAPIPVGKSYGALITAREVSPRGSREPEPHRIDQSRKERLSVVAADLQRLLSTVQGHAETIRRAGGEHGQVRGSAESILVAAEQMEALIGELHDLAPRQPERSESDGNAKDLRSRMLRLKQQLVPWLG